MLPLVVAAKEWRGRPRDGDAVEMPKWMRAIDTFAPAKAAGLAVMLAAVNPKNLLLTVGAGAAIAQTGAPAGEQAIAPAVFVVVGTPGPGAPVAIYFALGKRSTEPLEELRRWMSSHNAAIMAVLCLVIGAKLIGDALSAF